MTLDQLAPLRRAFFRHAPTLRGQVAGIGLMLLPALAHPLTVGDALHGVLQILAAVLASIGLALVFGGMAVRTWLRDAHDAGDPDGLDDPHRLDVTLLALPHRRRVWQGLLALAVLFGVGALWCLALVPGPGWSGQLAATLLFALPAIALGLVAWRFRAMTAASPWTTDEPDEPELVSSP